MKLRILHLMSCRGWSSDAYWAARMVAEQRRLGHEVVLAVRDGTRILAQLAAMGAGDLLPLRLTGGLAPASDLRDLFALRTLLPRFDLVHVHRGKEHWLAALAPSPIPIVRTRHIVGPIRPHPLNRWLYARTALVVAVAEAIGAHYRALGLLPPDRLAVLHGGVDAEAFRPDLDGAAVRRGHGIPDEAPLVGVVAGLRVMKGHRTLLEAAAGLAHRVPAARFLLMGQGPEEAAIRREIARLGLGERVILAGYVEPLPPALCALDVAVYPSRTSEGMGRALFEYMAAGCPIVATRVGVAPEVLVDGESALLVPPEAPEALVAAIARLLDDPALARGLGRAARRAVEARYAGGEVARRLVELYAGLLGGRG